MFCTLVGIVPPPTPWQVLQRILREEVSCVCEDKVKWTNSSSPKPTILNDQGTPTLLIRAVSEAMPDSLVEAVETALATRLDGHYKCELWASCPALVPLPPVNGGHDVNAPNTNDDDDKWGMACAEMIRCTGMMHQRQVLSSRVVAEIRTACMKAIEQVDKALALHHPSIDVGKDAFVFSEIASRGNERFDLRLEQTIMDTFVQEHVLENSHVKSLLEQLFESSKFDYDVSVVYSRPGANHQDWHADGGHINGALDAGWAEDGWKTRLASAYAVCLFIPLIDLTDETGFTQFWPESHRHRHLAGFSSVAELTPATWDGKCVAGDGVWYDYRLFHRGMPNKSSSVIRPVLQVIFKKPWYVERANYGTKSIYSTR